MTTLMNDGKLYLIDGEEGANEAETKKRTKRRGKEGGEEDMKGGKEKERKRGRVTRKMTAITAFGFPNLRFTFTAR